MGCRRKSNSLKRFFGKIFGRTRKKKQKRRGRKRQKGGETRNQVHKGRVHKGQMHKGQMHKGQVHKGQVHKGPVRSGKNKTKKVLLPSENKTRSSTKSGGPAFYRIKKGVEEGFDKAMSFITDKQRIMNTNLNGKFEDMKGATSDAAQIVLQKGKDVVNNATNKINNTAADVNSKFANMKKRTLKNKRNALCNMAISLMNASQRAQFKNIDCGGRKTKKRSLGSLPGNRVLNREHRHSSTKR
jgi:hypothetical protein